MAISIQTATQKTELPNLIYVGDNVNEFYFTAGFGDNVKHDCDNDIYIGSDAEVEFWTKYGNDLQQVLNAIKELNELYVEGGEAQKHMDKLFKENGIDNVDEYVFQDATETEYECAYALQRIAELRLLEEWQNLAGKK